MGLIEKKCDKKTLILHKTTYPALRRPQGAFLISPTDIIEHHLQKKGLVEKKDKIRKLSGARDRGANRSPITEHKSNKSGVTV